jgi:hypothetical protein
LLASNTGSEGFPEQQNESDRVHKIAQVQRCPFQTLNLEHLEQFLLGQRWSGQPRPLLPDRGQDLRRVRLEQAHHERIRVDRLEVVRREVAHREVFEVHGHDQVCP